VEHEFTEEQQAYMQQVTEQQERRDSLQRQLKEIEKKTYTLEGRLRAQVKREDDIKANTEAGTVGKDAPPPAAEPSPLA
jgi:septal ring factor EnvC (AmiA/AmiB activator)